MSFYDILKALFRALNRIEGVDTFEAYHQQKREVTALADALMSVVGGRNFKARMMAYRYRMSAWETTCAQHTRLCLLNAPWSKGPATLDLASLWTPLASAGREPEARRLTRYSQTTRRPAQKPRYKGLRAHRLGHSHAS